jgi:alpha-D-ribose 1-methylphosphonate 5-triphosphate synthase subunit PhnH
MSVASIMPGFRDPVRDAQMVFRRLLGAMSYPGRAVAHEGSRSVPAPLHASSYALCLTLMDVDTPVWLDPAARSESLLAHLAFHCGCPVVDSPARAAFALISAPGSMPDLATFNAGLDAYPDRSTTVIIQVESLVSGAPIALSGPGILGTTRLQVRGLPPAFSAMWRANRARYPQGVDVILTDPGHMVGLPRSCHLED